LFLTIATTDYLPRVGALHASLAEAYGRDVPFAALCIGDEAIDAQLAALRFESVRVADLNIPTFWDMAFRYEKGALANALKPFFIRRMLAERAPDWIVFLDADTLVYSRFEEVHGLLDTGAASIVLTPHFDRPQHRAREPFEIDLLRHGVTNGGFVALTPSPSAGAFLDWWADHLRTGCRYEPEQGYYGDQHWLDLAPALFDCVHVLRHRGYNAAYWNHPDRSPRRIKAGWFVDDEPLRFFHFSQWRIEQGESVEGCMERLFGYASSALAELLQGYLDSCSGAGRTIDPELGRATYPFDRFLDGARIPRIVREAYARANPPRTLGREALFGAGVRPFNEPSNEVPAFDEVTITRLYVHIWRSRPDLRRFELATREGQLGFLRWVLAHAQVDHELPEEAIGPARRSLAPVAVVDDVAELEQAVAAARNALAATYAEYRDGKVGLEAVMAQARVCTGLVIKSARLDIDLSELTDDPIDLFRVARTLRSALNRSLGAHFDEVFTEIDGHGAYLAGKLGQDYETFLHGLPDLRDDALQEPHNGSTQDAAAQLRPVSPEDIFKADAVLNASSNLIDIAQRWTRRDEFAPQPPSPTLFVTAYDERADPASPFDPWELGQLRELAAIEPRLAFQLARDASAFRAGGVRAADNPLHHCLTENETVLDPPPLAVVALGAASPGDSDGALLRAAQGALGTRNVLVVQLDAGHPEPGEAFADGTRLFCAASLAPTLTGEQRFQFARDYLSNVQPRIILNLGSEVVWRLYGEHGRALSTIARLQAGLSRIETASEAMAGPVARYLPEALPHLSVLLSDNAQLKAKLAQAFAFPAAWLEKVESIRKPVDVPDLGPVTSMRRFRGALDGRPSILWAGSVSQLSRPDLLIKIARSMPDCQFDVYGAFENEEIGSDIFQQVPNIRYNGSFSSLSELPHEAFDAVLHTSPETGMPPTLLTAAALRVPIVAAAVGGVPDLVSDERGWLVRDDANPAAYREALAAALSGTPVRLQRVQAMLEYVAREHSRAAFARRIEELGLFELE